MGTGRHSPSGPSLNGFDFRERFSLRLDCHEFKTTIVLIILLAGIGGYLYFTREKTATDTTPVVHTLLDVKSADVTAMSITSGDGKQITAQKSSDANGQAVWRLTQPVTAAADTFKVGSLLDEITALKSNNVVPQTGADAPPHTGWINRNTPSA